jgi:hypothetical protein
VKLPKVKLELGKQSFAFKRAKTVNKLSLRITCKDITVSVNTYTGQSVPNTELQYLKTGMNTILNQSLKERK